MRGFFLIVFHCWAAEYLVDSTPALECHNGDDTLSLLQTQKVLHSKVHQQYTAVEDGHKSLEEIKHCLSELAGLKPVKEQDLKISDSELKTIVQHVKACAGSYGMEEEEYLHFMTYVRDHAPQKLLVWGLGADSIVLDLLNFGGETLFLEPDPEWIDVIQSTSPGLHVVSFDQETFNTTVGSYQDFLKIPHRADWVGPLQGQPCWDTVLVDSPIGGSSEPSKYVGRAVPMYTAFADVERCKKEGKYKANAEISVFVHDCNRLLEDQASVALFGSEKLQHEVGPKKLRQFCLTCSPMAFESAKTTESSGGIMDDVASIAASVGLALLEQHMNKSNI